MGQLDYVEGRRSDSTSSIRRQRRYACFENACACCKKHKIHSRTCATTNSAFPTVMSLAGHKNGFSPKTLIGNWYESRCEPDFKAKTQFHTPKVDAGSSRYETTCATVGAFSPMAKDRSPAYKASSNWYSFQKKDEAMFSTTYQGGFTSPSQQTSPFKAPVAGEKSSLQQYRERWTTGRREFPRTYLGAQHSNDTR
eukprot:GILJ01007708.1.p1 GENE.GILJ01007708.1~~GILJ01007708.1.p1  ORF type:complete len:196 (-),score=6.87 GILJ01007708.1:242-829(-)